MAVLFDALFCVVLDYGAYFHINIKDGIYRLRSEEPRIKKTTRKHACWPTLTPPNQCRLVHCSPCTRPTPGKSAP